MTVTIKTYIARSIPAENQYRVTFSVIEAINIPPQVFVFDTEHQLFSRVASVLDMEVFPASRTAAITASLAFYRTTSVARVSDTVNDSTEFELVTRNRLTILSTAWNAIGATYPGSEYFTAES
jgi:hypothetical protein